MASSLLVGLTWADLAWADLAWADLTWLAWRALDSPPAWAQEPGNINRRAARVRTTARFALCRAYGALDYVAPMAREKDI
jgi:hypothetical protein